MFFSPQDSVTNTTFIKQVYIISKGSKNLKQMNKKPNQTKQTKTNKQKHNQSISLCLALPKDAFSACLVRYTAFQLKKTGTNTLSLS